MATFRWGDDEVWWDRTGAGPPLVLCHGTPWSSRVWDRTAAGFADRYTVHRFDLLGYGRSTQRDGQDVSLAVQGRLFTAILEHWGLDRPHVVAHDIGGAVALRATLLHGAAFASLTLVDVVALAPWGSPFFSLVRDHAEVFQQLPGPMHRAMLDTYMRSAFHLDVSREVVEELAAPWVGPIGQDAFYRQIAQADQAHTDEVEPHYGELDLPVHVVWGTDDPWIPVDRAHELHGRIPGATLQLLDGVGHLAHVEAPQALADALEQALAGSPPD